MQSFPMGKHCFSRGTTTCEVLSGHGLGYGPTGFEYYPMGLLDRNIGKAMDS